MKFEFFSQGEMHYKRIRCLKCGKLGEHLEECTFRHLLPVKLLFMNDDRNESYPIAIITPTNNEIPNVSVSDGLIQMPNHPWLLTPRGYKWDKREHHYVWMLNEGETEQGPFTGKQMSAQVDFFAEQAAKGLVDKRVLKELECSNDMVAQLWQAREVLARE